MAFTLEQLNFLKLNVGVAIPPEFIENKKREAEFKKRSAQIAARAEEMKQRRDGPQIEELFQRAKGLASQGKNFLEALALLDETEQRLEQPDLPAPPALPVWQEAKDTVDAQLEQLYGKLKKTGLPTLIEVASEIESVLENYRTKLVAALMSYDAATGGAKDQARAKASQIVASYQASLSQDKHVIAADTNPFGVPVNIRETLGTALAALAGQLATAG